MRHSLRQRAWILLSVLMLGCLSLITITFFDTQGVLRVLGSFPVQNRPDAVIALIDQMEALRWSLRSLLVAMVALFAVIFWLGEQAFKPIDQLRTIVQKIIHAEGRVFSEDHRALPQLDLSRDDEVSALAQEFHAMAVTLVERDKVVGQQQHKLTEQNRRLNALALLNHKVFEAMPTMVLAWDQYGHLTHINEQAAVFFGIEPIAGRRQEFKKIPKLVYILGLAAHQEEIDFDHKTLRVKSSSLCDDRSQETLHDQDSPSLSEQNKDELSGLDLSRVVLIEDVTEIKNMRKQLEMAEQFAVIGRLSAQVAHEIGNPLQSIRLEAELAQDQIDQIPPLQGRIKSTLQTSTSSILHEVDRLKNITRNYLKLSKMTSGEKSGQVCADLCERVLATYAAQLEEQKIYVSWHGNPELAVYGDGDLIEIALGNLFKNSIQAFESIHTDRRRNIELLWESYPVGKVLWTYRDNGPGIPDQVMGNLFRPFVTSKAQGTGLGLSLVRKVFQEQGGDFYLEESSDSGTVFKGILREAQNHVQDSCYR